MWNRSFRCGDYCQIPPKQLLYKNKLILWFIEDYLGFLIVEINDCGRFLIDWIVFSNHLGLLIHQRDEDDK